MLDKFIRSRGYIKPQDILITVSLPTKKHPHFRHLLRMTVAYMLAIQKLSSDVVKLGNIVSDEVEVQVTIL